MTQPVRLPRCGDHVIYRPTGEIWLIAYAEGDSVVPAGQPLRSAPIADCDVVFRCSDDDHARQVSIWNLAEEDSRREHVTRLYGVGAAKPGLLVPANARRRPARKAPKSAA